MLVRDEHYISNAYPNHKLRHYLSTNTLQPGYHYLTVYYSNTNLLGT